MLKLLSCRWENLTLGYTEADGDPILRKEIAKLYESVSEEHVTVMIPQEAISVASRSPSHFCIDSFNVQFKVSKFSCVFIVQSKWCNIL